MGLSSGSFMIEQLKLFELPNMDPYLVQHVHITELSLVSNIRNYNINLLNIKIICIYKELYYNCIKDILKILTY
jgi:hypothetical protein